MDYAKLRHRINERIALPKYQAGLALGWGRRATDEAIAAGLMPVIHGPKETVPTAWLRRVLDIAEAPQADRSPAA